MLQSPCFLFFFFSSRRRHTRCYRDWSSDVCSSDLAILAALVLGLLRPGQPPPNDAPETFGAQPAETAPAAPTRTGDQLMADGQARLSQGDVAAALADFEAAAAAEPVNSERIWGIASLLSDFGYSEDAGRYLDQAVILGPDDPPFHDAAGWFYSDLGFMAEAVAPFQRALELDPEALGSYLGVSEAARALGDTALARQALDAVMASPIAPNPGLYEGAGWGYLALEAWPEAQAAFGQAVSLDPATSGAWSGLAEATYEGQG